MKPCAELPRFIQVTLLPSGRNINRFFGDPTAGDASQVWYLAGFVGAILSVKTSPSDWLDLTVSQDMKSPRNDSIFKGYLHLTWRLGPWQQKLVNSELKCCDLLVGSFFMSVCQWLFYMRGNMKKITGNHRNPSTSLVGLESAGTHLPQFFLNSGGGSLPEKFGIF